VNGWRSAAVSAPALVATGMLLVLLPTAFAVDVGPVGPPGPYGAPVGAATLARVVPDTAEVVGVACGNSRRGTGFRTLDGVMVTAAHVVAGEKGGQTEVILSDGRRLEAAVVWFDPIKDVALLRVGAWKTGYLKMSSDGLGVRAAVLGHPEGQAQTAATQGVITDEVDLAGSDLYHRESTLRHVYVLQASVQPGDSGGPVVDSTGQVLGMAFASSERNRQVGYALSSEELKAVLVEANSRTSPVSTGRCLGS